jgi:hypothetical protein
MAPFSGSSSQKAEMEHADPHSVAAITFLAQWHPLIRPKSNTLRPGFEDE